MCRQNHALLLALIILCALPLSASQKYEATGILIQLDQPHQTITVSCKEIPGYMEAMTMSFPVRDPKTLDHLEPGSAIDFSLVVDKNSSYVDNLRPHPFDSLELDPTQARRYKLMEQAIATRSAADVLHVGQPVPDSP